MRVTFARFHPARLRFVVPGPRKALALGFSGVQLGSAQIAAIGW